MKVGVCAACGIPSWAAYEVLGYPVPGDRQTLWRASDPKAYHAEYGFSCMPTSGYASGRRMAEDGSHDSARWAVAEMIEKTVVLHGRPWTPEPVKIGP